MAYFTLLVAISIAAVAAWYSIIGLMAIFAAAAIPIAIMGGVLEDGASGHHDHRAAIAAG